ncbi:MAG: preprotein translocase subunit SecG [Prevotella sp.]|jgi:preprotein translocase subunit SecG|nr:preprotein translocase subunit SecG [Prevotella sp.]MCR5152931.1 preprotein translocase subunit SecG [Prevotella sp.]
MLLYSLFLGLIIIASLLMIGIVLIQESKGGGLSSNFSSSNQFMGVRKTTDFVEKATWTLAAAMVVCSIACAWVAPKASGTESVMESAPAQSSTANPNNLPSNFGTPQQAAPAKDAKAPAADAKTEAAPKAEAPAADAKAPAAPAAEAPAQTEAPAAPAK